MTEMWKHLKCVIKKCVIKKSVVCNIQHIAWNSLPLETRACSSLLTFRRETKSHLFRQSYGWCGAIYSSGQQMSALSCATVLDLDFCKVPPQLYDGSTLIHDICNSSSAFSSPFHHRWPCVCCCRSTSVEQPTIWHSNIYTIIRHVQETSEILPLSTVFFQPVELVTTCTLTMLGALEVVRAAYCALWIV